MTRVLLCISSQVFTGAPPPVIDFVTTQFFGSPVAKPPAEQVPTFRFKLKKMDSGPLGLRSITSPVGYQADTGRFDADSSKLNFKLETPCGSPGTTTSRQ